jgi:hypothetical protein
LWEGREKRGEGGEGVWCMDFMYLYEIDKKLLAIAISGAGRQLGEGWWG